MPTKHPEGHAAGPVHGGNGCAPTGHETDMLDETSLHEIEPTLAEKKRAAYEMVADAMAEAEAEGIDRDIVAQAALFAVVSDLVATWGEVEVADFVERMVDRVLAGEFTINRQLQ